MYHERMKNFLDEEKFPNSSEIGRFLRDLRDDVLENFHKTLKFKSQKNEKKFIDYRQKLIEFMNQKEDIAKNLSGGSVAPEENEEYIEYLLKK